MNLVVLTPRQAEVAELIARGLGNRDIASRLGVSRETVKVHVRQAAGRIGSAMEPRETLAVWFYLTHPEVDDSSI